MILNIAEQYIEVSGNLQYMKDDFYKFEENGPAEKNIDVLWEIREGMFNIPKHCKKMFESRYCIIYEGNGRYYTEYPDYNYSFATEVEINSGNAVIYILDSVKNESMSVNQNNFSFVLRDTFWERLRVAGMMAIHSSTIIYNGKAYMFSGLSGTGKTTHTNMWTEYYNVEILDGDMCICGIKNEKIYAYGSPWHGSSGKFLNKRVELGGIIFLHQAKENYIMEMNELNKIINIYYRNFIIPLCKKHVSELMNTASIISKRVMCLELYNKPEREAVEIIKKRIV